MDMTLSPLPRVLSSHGLVNKGQEGSHQSLKGLVEDGVAHGGGVEDRGDGIKLCKSANITTGYGGMGSQQPDFGIMHRIELSVYSSYGIFLPGHRVFISLHFSIPSKIDQDIITEEENVLVCRSEVGRVLWMWV